MNDYPNSVGFRDVIAAWVVCLAVAGGFLLYPLLTASGESAAVEAKAVPRAILPAPPAQFCTASKSPVDMPHG